MKKMFIVTLFLISCGRSNSFHQRGVVKIEDLKEGLIIQQSIVLDNEYYEKNVLPVLENHCIDCNDNSSTDFDKDQTFVVLESSDQNELMLKVMGPPGDHTVVLQRDSAEVAILLNWINGASLSVTSTTTTSSTTTTLDPVPTPISPEDFFKTNMLPLLERDCKKCHANPGSDYAKAKSKITAKNESKSVLFVKASGTGHKKVWPVGSAESDILKAWINIEN